MSKYSSTISFEIEIERIKSRESGLLFSIDSIPSYDDFEYDYVIITLQVEGRYYFAAGRSYGFFDNCYPDESETEITLVNGPDDKDWEDQLTEAEKDYIINSIKERVIDSYDGPDPDDYLDDYDRD